MKEQDIRKIYREIQRYRRDERTGDKEELQGAIDKYERLKIK